LTQERCCDILKTYAEKTTEKEHDMTTRNPRNLADAFTQIATAAEELGRARARYNKAAQFLLHYGNTPATSSPEFHYSIAITNAFRQHYSDLVIDLNVASVTYNDATETEDAG